MLVLSTIPITTNSEIPLSEVRICRDLGAHTHKTNTEEGFVNKSPELGE